MDYRYFVWTVLILKVFIVPAAIPVSDIERHIQYEGLHNRGSNSISLNIEIPTIILYRPAVV